MKAPEEKIRLSCGCPGAEVYFLMGGTQTNAVVIGSMLRRFEGVIAASTGHVSVHEAGAVEYTGHKVLELPQKEGKIAAGTLKDYLQNFYGDENHEHMVFPGMLYLSIPRSTEPCIPGRNWRRFPGSAAAMRSRCSWTARGWDTVWPAGNPI